MNNSKLGLIAGGGMLPFEIITHCQKIQREIFVVGLEPYVTPEYLNSVPHVYAKLGEVGKILKSMKKNEVSEVLLAGWIKRPTLKDLIPDWEGAKLMARLAMNKMTDDNLFRVVMKEIESRGFTVVGTEDVVPEMLFSEGVYGKIKPTSEDMLDIERGIGVAKALGAVDVGQAAVVQQGMVLAVEAMEGTDMMLSRAATIKRKGKAPVMVKIVKPGQDRRVDMPVIGVQTIEQLIKYEIAGIAVEPGGILLIERDSVIKLAYEAGKFIIGMKI